MRKIFTFIFAIILGVVGFCIGCEYNPTQKTPQIVYKIGQRYITDYCEYTVSHDSHEERFVFDFVDKDLSTCNYFNFIFTYDNLNSLRNSLEFTYIDSLGQEIVF
ncbi:MAG: hypothetical protein IKC64_04350, partial [Clostridia bacterium]|nr:hypothetical protein [Clostridia bacterium]